MNALLSRGIELAKCVEPPKLHVRQPPSLFLGDCAINNQKTGDGSAPVTTPLIVVVHLLIPHIVVPHVVICHPPFSLLTSMHTSNSGTTALSTDLTRDWVSHGSSTSAG
jgi:hypothetical protein